MLGLVAIAQKCIIYVFMVLTFLISTIPICYIYIFYVFMLSNIIVAVINISTRCQREPSNTKYILLLTAL